jgi:penicillin amidase
MSPVSRFLTGLLGAILILAILAGAFAYYTARRSFPQMDGDIQLSGLNEPVEIYRDPLGVPHIYASNQHDLFFAQGFVHAQDRFYQMDFWRHIGSGRLSEMFGDAQLEKDQFLRTMGWARVARQELDKMEPEELALLQDYADGVNAYLAEHQGSALSLEYAVLKLINADYQIEPWEPLNSLTWAKVMAYDLGGNMESEIYRARLLKSFSPQQAHELLPDYPQDHPYIVPQPNTAAFEPQATLPQANWFENPAIAALLENSAQQIAQMQPILGPTGAGIGSNNWVIAGERTSTGQPFLANDPHLGEQMPSIWYEIGLHCTPKGPDCPYEVSGFSFAGNPGVIIGHNDRIAWGVTNVGPDVQDLFIEKINPENPNQYEVNGQWIDMQLVQESIQVAGADPVPLTVRYTRHGPLVSDVSFEDFGEQAGIDLPEHYALALRWTALEPGTLQKAILGIDQAQNWQDFRQAAALFNVPAQNLVYADVDGNIGYQMPGSIPIRAGGDGSLPAPGWNDDYAWTGYIPFEELPFAFNPPQGYIATANNAVVGPDYRYLISTDWDYGFRAQRIVEMIENAPGAVDQKYIQKMQGDNLDPSAPILVPLITQMSFEEPRLQQARDLLANWDYQNDMNSAPAALYAAFWRHLLANTFDDDLPEQDYPSGGSRWIQVVTQLAREPQSAWWDDGSTPQQESRDEILRQSFQAAVSDLEENFNNDPQSWTWGSLHSLTFHNQSLGLSGISMIESIFNRGPFQTSGGASIVNATGWDAVESYQVVSLPSMRMIVDLSDLSKSQSIHTTGQSGHAYHPHYIDMADMWRKIQYHPMYWSRDQIQAAAEGRLELSPSP